MAALAVVGRKPIATTDDWKEDHLQAHAVKEVHEEISLETVVAKIKSLNKLSIIWFHDSSSLPSLKISASLTLADFRVTQTNPLHQELVTKLKLQPSIDLINKHFTFYERLNESDPSILTQIYLISLQILTDLSAERIPYSEMYLALAPPETIARISIHEIEQLSSLKVLAIRIDDLFKNCPLLKTQINAEAIKAPLFSKPNFSIAKFRTSSAQAISKIAHKLPAQLFQLLTDDQFRSMDFKHLSKNQIIQSISGLDENQGTKNRLAMCSQEQFKDIISKGAITSSFLRLLPNDILCRFPFELLSKEDIHDFLVDFWWVNSQEQQEKIHSFSASSIQMFLEKDVAPSSFVQHLSDEQVQSLNIARLPENPQRRLFCLDTPAQNRKKMALIAPPLINLWLPTMHPDLYEFLSDEQFQALDTSPLTDAKKRSLFCSGTLDQKKRKIALIAPPIINDWLPEMSEKFFSLLSDAQLKEIDAARLTPNQIKLLFPTLEIACFFEGIYTRKQEGKHLRHYYDERFENGGYSHTGFNDDEIQRQLEQRKATCKKNLNLFSNAQIAQVQHHLSPEILALKD